jgi:hypothetical protein
LVSFGHGAVCPAASDYHFLPLIYPPELEVKETTDTASSASFLDLYLEFDDSTTMDDKIIATGPCIANQLRDVNTICRRSWYIAAHVWKIDDFKIEVIPFKVYIPIPRSCRNIFRLCRNDYKRCIFIY